jgi:benzoate/toluate 1,2-dioxygenase alpha subunit/2,4,5-trichlorophenoxyacetic acid oxygenase 1
MTDEKDGQYPPSFLADDHGLKPVPKIASYRGLLFASVSPDVPTLEEHLGDARAFIDLVVDQGIEGLEFVDGNVSYTFDAN